MFYRVKSSKPIGVGRFPAGDYSLTYDAAGRLTSDGTRGITSVLYNDWSGIPILIRAEGFRVNAEVTPDGKLRCRSVSVPYIETIVKVNAEGDTIVRQYTRNLSRSTRIYGCFHVSTEKKKLRLQINTSVGFYDIDEGRQYWHLTNYQGSVMALVDTDGRTHRRSALYPSVTPFVLNGDDTTVPDPGLPDDRHHIGNRWVSFGGLDWYDNTARMHDPLLMRFTAPDPLARDYLCLSPWSHCAANPANITDPDGKRVWAFDSYGYISLVSKTDCRDVERFIFVNGNSEQVKDDNGDPIQIDIEKGSVITLQRYREGVDFDVIKVRGDENGMILYHFLSDITGKESGIEFSYVQTGKEGKNGLNFISTSHKIKAEASMSSLYNTQLSNGYTVRFDSHSHPGGSPPSPNDKEYKIQISNLSKSLKAHVPKFSIYSVPQKEEQPF